MAITLNHFLVLSALLFSVGLYGTLSKRNAVAILMCIELMLNAVNVALVAFARFVPPSTAEVVGYAGSGPAPLRAGQVFALFIITIAAAEAAVGLAIVLAIYRTRHHVAAEDIDLMKW